MLLCNFPADLSGETVRACASTEVATSLKLAAALRTKLDQAIANNRKNPCRPTITLTIATTHGTKAGNFHHCVTPERI
jgi:hypothetical protein